MFTARYGLGIYVRLILIFPFKACTIVHAVSRQPLKAEVRVRSQVSPCEILVVDTIALWDRFISHSFCLPCQYHSTNAPLSPVGIIPPMFHSPCQYHSTNAPLSPVSIIPPTLLTHLHLHVALTRRTNRRQVGTFQKAVLFPKSENIGKKRLPSLNIKHQTPQN